MRVDLIFPELTIPTDESDFFHQMVCPLTLQKDEYFVAPDARCNKIAFIESGLLCSLKIKGGKKIILTCYPKNQFVSVFTSFLTGGRAAWAIKALEPTCLMVVSNNLFHELCQRHTCWTQFWIRVFGTQTSDLIECEKHLSHT